MKECVTLEWGGRPLVFETGRMAKQADGAILAQYGETVVLVTVVASKKPREGADFFPLSVDYMEKTYAAGKIPGGFFKREGRPGTREILSARFIDRTLRPLFPNGYLNEVQIIATVLSADEENDPDILAISAASAALEISKIPFAGPIAGVKVGRINGEFVINPSAEMSLESELEIVVAGSQDAIVMVEGSAENVSEKVLLDAIMFGHESIQGVINIQKDLKSRAGKEKMIFTEAVIDSEIEEKVRQKATEPMRSALLISEKLDRYDKLREIRGTVIEEVVAEHEDGGGQIRAVIEKIESELIRGQILTEGKRIGGRTPVDIRQIDCEVSVLPRTHGSSLFTRGETQAMVAVTLGTAGDEQRIDSLAGESRKAFMLHYNFPPFSVGEARFLRGTSRREIGHGFLAEKAIAQILPSAEDFPYTIRIVSEVLESNGSSSMASVCGSTLSLMDAGVPIKAPVAGIAMGLIQDGDNIIILSDILGDEDHVGDMDFKVAGTREGITAIQMDIKIDGLTSEILSKALEQAREGRLHILDKMAQTIKDPREDLSPRAPRIEIVKVRPDKVSVIIGPGGKNIKNIIATAGVKVDVDDDGNVMIASPDKDSIDKAIAMVKGLVEEPEVGKIYVGKVQKIMDFGAFVEIMPGTDGLVHISQLDNERVQNVRDILKEGDEVLVKVLEIDPQGKIRLSRKAVLNEDINKYKK